MINILSSKTKHLFSFVLLLCIVFLSAFTSMAQITDTIIPVHENPEKLLRHVRLGQYQSNDVSIQSNEFTGHLTGIDFGFNMFLNENYSGYDSEFMKNDLLHSNSIYVNFDHLSIGLQRNKNTIGLVAGVGLQLYNYRLNNNITIERDLFDVIQPVPITLENIKKSNLTILAVQIPLLAEFQIPVGSLGNRIYFSAGTYGRIRLLSHTKVKYKLERNEKLKTADNFSIRDFGYGIMVRTGYRWVNLFATYDLVPFFKDNRGPELTPFTFGVTLISF